MYRIFYICLLVTILSCESSSNSEKETPKASDKAEINWKSFDESAFEHAASTDKLVLLEVGANWCHWCHVMDEKTYADTEVQEYLNEHFVLTREDQDSRPDLYSLYRTWGWPAIIVFNSNKEEVLKLKGYQEKTKFLKKLKETVANPEPIKSDRVASSNLNASNQELFTFFLKRIDHEKGGYPWNHKYLHPPGIFHGLAYYNENDSLKKWTDFTIEQSYLLVDPVWSGVYQYSAKKSWKNQHYEKLLRIQANYIQAYAKYGSYTGDQKATQTAIEIYNYCERFLGSDSPLFYNSQNADVIEGQDSEEYYNSTEQERLKQGTPSVDEHCYLKENAMMGKALLYLWAATGDEKYLGKVQAMISHIDENVEQTNGVYWRGDREILSLEGNRQFLHLLMLWSQLTGSEEYLEMTKALAHNMIRIFDSKQGLLATSSDLPIPAPIVPLDNLNAVLTFNLLGHLSGDDDLINYAQDLYQKIDKKSLAEKVGYLPLLLRAKVELEQEPFHAVYITDGSDEKRAQEFYRTLLNYPNPYIVFERAVIGKFSKEQELLYSGMPSGTLFMCTSSFCSAPMQKVEQLEDFLTSN
ncbi:MAG: thioredoxin domain-containing protein [Crocinitomicaceae bacterium]|nr:thioredoxin domain-containing protein [Crocinitomicaceae bacterium]